MMSSAIPAETQTKVEPLPELPGGVVDAARKNEVKK